MKPERLDPYEGTRPCDCCGAPGALSQGRQEICGQCLAAECDPLDELCRHVELEECEDNACAGCDWCDHVGTTAEPSCEQKVEQRRAARAEQVRLAAAEVNRAKETIGALSETLSNLASEYCMMRLEDELVAFAETLEQFEQGPLRLMAARLNEERARLVRMRPRGDG